MVLDVLEDLRRGGREEVGDLVERLGGKLVDGGEEAVGVGDFQRCDSAFLGGNAELVEQRGEVGDAAEFVGDECAGDVHVFEEEGSFKADDTEVGLGGGERRDEAVLHFLQGKFGVVNLVGNPQELAGDVGLLDEPRRIAERFEEFVLLGNGRGAEDNQVALLGRDIEVRVAFGEAFGVVPPFLPVGRGDDGRREDRFESFG